MTTYKVVIIEDESGKIIKEFEPTTSLRQATRLEDSVSDRTDLCNFTVDIIEGE